MTTPSQENKQRLIAGCLYALIAAAALFAIFKFSGLASGAAAPEVKVLVYAPEAWVDLSVPQTDEAVSAMFARAQAAAELARDAGYIVLYSESAFMVPEGARLTPEVAQHLEDQQ